MSGEGASSFGAEAGGGASGSVENFGPPFWSEGNDIAWARLGIVQWWPVKVVFNDIRGKCAQVQELEGKWEKTLRHNDLVEFGKADLYRLRAPGSQLDKACRLAASMYIRSNSVAHSQKVFVHRNELSICRFGLCVLVDCSDRSLSVGDVVTHVADLEVLGKDERYLSTLIQSLKRIRIQTAKLHVWAQDIVQQSLGNSSYVSVPPSVQDEEGASPRNTQYPFLFWSRLRLSEEAQMPNRWERCEAIARHCLLDDCVWARTHGGQYLWIDLLGSTTEFRYNEPDEHKGQENATYVLKRQVQPLTEGMNDFLPRMKERKLVHVTSEVEGIGSYKREIPATQPVLLPDATRSEPRSAISCNRIQDISQDIRLYPSNHSAIVTNVQVSSNIPAPAQNQFETKHEAQEPMSCENGHISQHPESVVKNEDQKPISCGNEHTSEQKEIVESAQYLLEPSVHALCAIGSTRPEGIHTDMQGRFLLVMKLFGQNVVLGVHGSYESAKIARNAVRRLRNQWRKGNLTQPSSMVEVVEETRINISETTV